MKRSLLFILLFPFSSIIHSQQNQIKNLVFEGAGMRGIAYCGILNELESRGLMQHIEKVGGTSAGALMALTVSLGYNAEEIREIIGTTNFKKLNDGRYFFIGGINRVNKQYGWYRGERLEKWITSIISKKTGNPDITFEQLVQRGYKGLYVTGSCLNRQSLIIFSHETYPKMKICDAIRISMTIPLYFKPVFIDKDGKRYKKTEQASTLDVMVDGGITGNFPIHLFDSAGYVNMSTLGFRIDTKQQIENDKGDKTLAARPIGNFNEFLTAFYTMTLENLNRQSLTNSDWQRTVSISDGNISPRIRKLNKKEIEVLIANGSQAMKTYLN
ncbi:MAG TPA: patatin-like phospholipase family protein [Chitinophagaceae bacterium]